MCEEDEFMGERKFVGIPEGLLAKTPKARRQEEYESLNPKQVLKKDTQKLIKWQSEYDKDDPQWKLAELELQVRTSSKANKPTRRIAYIALGVSFLSLVLTTYIYFYPHHKPSPLQIETKNFAIDLIAYAQDYVQRDSTDQEDLVTVWGPKINEMKTKLYSQGVRSKKLESLFDAKKTARTSQELTNNLTAIANEFTSMAEQIPSD